MAEIQNNISDGFMYISDIIHHLGVNTSEKSRLQQLACLDFVRYLNCKSKYPEKIQSIQELLLIPENRILEALSEFIISDKEIETIRNSVGLIQQLFLDNLPPETMNFNFLKQYSQIY